MKKIRWRIPLYLLDFDSLSLLFSYPRRYPTPDLKQALPPTQLLMRKRNLEFFHNMIHVGPLPGQNFKSCKRYLPAYPILD